ncbi:hypothetical protein L1987_35554 [Smallanthus sonchifolius]|uniref:Uncharacterized protein n=1 Tax=Smallanthus sonchifolius TaxID=185202 RepID=A0ACB9HW77_9ASTR|nr:hypothetical protein L1987_35554 [Smallanthus sonchifolius]
MSWSSCPFCTLQVLSTELERHANNHFEDEDLDLDLVSSSQYATITLVGIQMKRLPNGTQQSNLLILDPAHKTRVLESCLSKKVGWQRFIKRGVHTLKKMEYQLCYVDPGIATGAEMEKLKTLDSTRFEFQHL